MSTDLDLALAAALTASTQHAVVHHAAKVGFCRSARDNHAHDAAYHGQGWTRNWKLAARQVGIYLG